MNYCEGCGVDIDAEEEETGCEHECTQPVHWDSTIEWTT